IDPDQLDTSKAFIHTTVRVKQLGSDKERSFTLVAESEADIKLGKISVTSPIGKGLLGKSVGETAEVVTPTGGTKFEVLEITR
ncbi:MAG: GreA/GreB family elongation factor, partial [Flavobacteriales bacterium]